MGHCGLIIRCQWTSPWWWLLEDIMSWPSQLLVLSYRLYTAYHKTKCRPIWLSVLQSVYRQLMAQLWKTHLQAFWHHSITIPSTTWAAYIGLHVKHHISRVHRQRDILLTQWRREGGGAKGHAPRSTVQVAGFGGVKIWNSKIWPLWANWRLHCRVILYTP